MCVCPALVATPAVLAVHKPARHAVARSLHRLADNLDAAPRARAVPAVQYASLPCEPVLAGGPSGSLLDASLPGGLGGPGLGGPLAFGGPQPGRTLAYSGTPSVGSGGFGVPGGGGGAGGGGTVPGSPPAGGGGGSGLPVVAGVPEPESWAFMIAGMGAVGGVLRYRRVAPA